MNPIFVVVKINTTTINNLNMSLLLITTITKYTNYHKNFIEVNFLGLQVTHFVRFVRVHIFNCNHQ